MQPYKQTRRKIKRRMKILIFAPAAFRLYEKLIRKQSLTLLSNFTSLGLEINDNITNTVTYV